MYLHNRNTGDDFYDIVRKNRDRFSTGIVHSFTGGIEEIKQIVELDLYIGINGCSFKTQ
jgi:TatD DNase family protein